MNSNFDFEGFRAYVRSLIGDQTQREFAKSHGITPEHLSRMLKSPCPPVPSMKTIRKLAAGNNTVYQDLLRFAAPHVTMLSMPVQPVAKKPITAHNYQLLAARTINHNLSSGQIKAHALWGLAAEVGELQSLYQKKFQGDDFVPEHARKEVGDILWVLAEYCTGQGWDLGDVMQENIDNLRARYPDSFDPEYSLHRIDGDV